MSYCLAEHPLWKDEEQEVLYWATEALERCGLFVGGACRLEKHGGVVRRAQAGQDLHRVNNYSWLTESGVASQHSQPLGGGRIGVCKASIGMPPVEVAYR